MMTKGSIHKLYHIVSDNSTSQSDKSKDFNILATFIAYHDLPKLHKFNGKIECSITSLSENIDLHVIDANSGALVAEKIVIEISGLVLNSLLI